jgi:hypothetical protein
MKRSPPFPRLTSALAAITPWRTASGFSRGTVRARFWRAALAVLAICGAAHPAPALPDEAPIAASGDLVPATAKSASRRAPAKGAPATPQENFALRQAVIAWDMLAKVAAICPSADADPMDRLGELESTAKRRAGQSAKAVHARLDQEAPPVFMTPKQAMRVVANAGGCGAAALAQWRGRAAFVADVTRQVLAGQARADRIWPRDFALNGPLRVSVPGQRLYAGHVTVDLDLVNRRAVPLRVALLAPQLFVGLCTHITVAGAPVTQGYVPAEWVTIEPRQKAPVQLNLDMSCTRQPRVNVGGGLVIDDGEGPRYWRFLLRGVGQTPVASMP